MTNKGALYNNLVRLLENFSTTSAATESFYESLNSEEQEINLLNYSGRIENELLDNLKLAVTENNLFIVDNSHKQLIREIKDNFPEFPNARFDEIILLLHLISILNNFLSDNFDLTAEIENEFYDLILLSDRFGTNVFHYADANVQENSFILFDFGEIDQILSYFNPSTIVINQDLLIQFISKIGVENEILLDSFYALIYSEISTNIPKCKAYISLHMVMNGKIVHLPYEYSRYLSTVSSKPLDINNDYHQFKDALTILSEYNSQEDILDKFLRLYHIIENFMFKSPLVELERKQNGSPFSFRDFQRIHSKISKSELDSLKKFIQKVFITSYLNTTDFKNYTFALLQSKVSATPSLITKGNFNNLLLYLNIEKRNGEPLNYDDLEINTFYKHYSEILYALRNSLVHNKESEFHLTHETMLRHFEIGDTVKVLLEEFLLPTMEETIVCLLTETNNDIIWFSNSSLSLWEEN